MLALFSRPLLVKPRPQVGRDREAVDARRVGDLADDRFLVEVNDDHLGGVADVEPARRRNPPTGNPSRRRRRRGFPSKGDRDRPLRTAEPPTIPARLRATAPIHCRCFVFIRPLDLLFRIPSCVRLREPTFASGPWAGRLTNPGKDDKANITQRLCDGRIGSCSSLPFDGALTGHPPVENRYSYRSASIGSSWEAFRAG